MRATQAASLSFLVLIAAGYLAWGTAQTLSLKWADSLSAPDRFSFGRQVGASEDTMSFTVLYSFAHPFTQAFFMFCAEFSCLLVFLMLLAYKQYGTPCSADKSKAGGPLVVGEDVALPCNPCVWLLTAGADFLASIIQNVGMTMTDASVYQMLRGATVVWVAVISVVWLGRRFTKVELWGMGFVVIGLTLVGLSSVFRSSSGHTGATGDSHANKNPLLGNVLVITAQVLHAYQGVCQERLVHLYKIPPLHMVGMEGLYGMGLTIILLFVLQLVPTASWSHNVTGLREYFAPAPGGGSGRGPYSPAALTYTNVSWVSSLAPGLRVPFDDVILAFDQMQQCRSCLVATLVYIPAGFFYNACQMTIIKHMSTAATVMIGSLRNVSVWVVCLLLPSVFNERFSFLQFMGFIFLVLGNVLYQRVLITRFDSILPTRVIRSCPLLFADAPSEGAPEGAEAVVTPSSAAVTAHSMQQEERSAFYDELNLELPRPPSP